MDPIGAEDGFPDMWIQFGESSRLDYAFNHLGKHSKKIWYLLGSEYHMSHRLLLTAE